MLSSAGGDGEGESCYRLAQWREHDNKHHSGWWQLLNYGIAAARSAGAAGTRWWERVGGVTEGGTWGRARRGRRGRERPSGSAQLRRWSVAFGAGRLAAAR